MIKLQAISNPRKANGRWVDETTGCCFCGVICSAYIGIFINLEDQYPLEYWACLGCIHKAIDEVHKTILKQCEKRV